MFKVPPAEVGAIAPYVESPPYLGSGYPADLNWDALQSTGPASQVINNPDQMLPISTETVGGMYRSTAQGLGVGTPEGQLPFTQDFDTIDPGSNVVAANENVVTATSSTGSKMARGLVNTLLAPVQAIAGTISSIANGLKSMAEKAADLFNGTAIKNDLNFLENFKIKDAMKNIATSLAKGIEKTVGDIISIPKLMAQDMDKLSFFRNNSKRIATGVDTASYNLIGDDIINKMPKDLKMPAGMDLTDMKNVMNNFDLKQGALNVLNGAKKGVENIGQEAVKSAKQVLSNVNDFFNTLGSELKSGLSSISNLLNKSNSDPTKTRKAQVVIADIIGDPTKIQTETTIPVSTDIPEKPKVPDLTKPDESYKFVSGDPSQADPIQPSQQLPQTVESSESKPVDPQPTIPAPVELKPANTPSIVSVIEPSSASPISQPIQESLNQPPTTPIESIDSAPQTTPRYDPIPSYQTTGGPSMDVQQFDSLTQAQRIDYLNQLPVQERINQLEAYKSFVVKQN